MTDFKKMDTINFDILKILQEDGRISNLELSKKVGISPSPCLRRLNHLKDSGYIKGFYADINPKKLGFNILFFANIVILTEKEELIKEFEDSLYKIKDVREAFLLHTNKHYLVKVYARDIEHYKEIIREKISKLPYIESIKTTNIIKHVFNKHGINMEE